MESRPNYIGNGAKLLCLCFPTPALVEGGSSAFRRASWPSLASRSAKWVGAARRDQLGPSLASGKA